MELHLRRDQRILLLHQDGQQGTGQRDDRVGIEHPALKPRQVHRVHVPERHGGLAGRSAAVHPHRARGHRGSQIQARRGVHRRDGKLPGVTPRHRGGHRLHRRRRHDADDQPRSVAPRSAEPSAVSRPRHGRAGPPGDQDHPERGPRGHPPGQRGRLLAPLRDIRARGVRRRHLRAVQEDAEHAPDAQVGSEPLPRHPLRPEDVAAGGCRRRREVGVQPK